MFELELWFVFEKKERGSPWHGPASTSSARQPEPTRLPLWAGRPQSTAAQRPFLARSATTCLGPCVSLTRRPRRPPPPAYGHRQGRS